MYAVGAMSPTVQCIFFALAVICFLLAALGASFTRVGLLALGLAFFAFPFFWNQLAAA